MNTVIEVAGVVALLVLKAGRLSLGQSFLRRWRGPSPGKAMQPWSIARWWSSGHKVASIIPDSRSARRTLERSFQCSRRVACEWCRYAEQLQGGMDFLYFDVQTQVRGG